MLRKIPGFRSRTPWKMAVASIVYAVVLIFIVVAVTSPTKSPAPKPAEPTSSPPTPEQPAAAPTPAPEPTWQAVKEWKGTGIKTTETFEIVGKEWRIAWNATDEQVAGVLQIFVYDERDNLVTLAANQQGVGSDVSYVKAKPGRYYLTINSANVKWTIKVEELR